MLSSGEGVVKEHDSLAFWPSHGADKHLGEVGGWIGAGVPTGDLAIDEGHGL